MKDETPRVRSHAAVRPLLAARNVRVKHETQNVLNALFVDADDSQVAELRALPGVQSVVPDRRLYLLLDRAEQLIDVPAAWSALGGVGRAGAGIRIAVIDSGIQVSHPAFQDLTLTAPSGFPRCSLAKQTQTGFDCAQFTNGKVIVARSYVPLLGSSDPATSRPEDLSPRDHVGHGTAVATAAAGSANAAVTGVAPKSWVGSYKVFGSPGVINFTSSSAVIAALEDALNDGMDIAVLSLGGVALRGPLDTCSTAGDACDAEAVAVQNAVAAGMLVVVAGGNNGDTGTTVKPTLTTATSPGDAPNALTVAATTNSHNWSNGLNVSGLRDFHALLGTGPGPSGGALTAPLSDAAAAGDALACSALPAGSLAGTIALVQRGTCTFLVKVMNLQNAGAAGAVITNNPGDNTILAPGGLGGSTNIPATFVGYDDGQTIRQFLTNSPGGKATIESTLQAFDVSTGNQIAVFSSRGPALGTGAIKPEVAAVGTDLYLTGESYDPNGALYAPGGYLVSQGTSFSAPQIAGVAALVKQAHPEISPLAIKSAIVNTATQGITENGAPASVLAVGAGKADAAAAVAVNLVAQPSTVNFGILTGAFASRGIAVQLTNLSGSPLSLTLSLTKRTAETNAHLSVDRPNVTLAAGQSATVNLTLSGSLPSAGNYEGFVVVEGGASTLHIPFLYTVGDGVPYNIVPVLGDGDDGTVSQSTAIGYLGLQLLDRYGVPVSRAPVRFSVTSGGGKLQPDTSTDLYGLAFAAVTLGPTPGSNVFSATAGGLTTSFTATGRLQPVISTGGVVDAASFTKGAPVAPGSYVAIYGANLSDSTQISTLTPNLPLALNQTSVGFNSGALSVPGHLYVASPGQVNAQVPWELAGQTSAQMKVSVADSSGNLYTLPLAPYSPGIFEITSGGALYAAALDENFAVITPANPALRGHAIQIYCNGLGPVTNQPASGDPSPSNPLAWTMATPVVTIGGQTARVQFNGLTPTAVGLYQINLTVPDVPAGTQPVIVSIGGVNSKVENIVVR